jgi:hypothetical protein
VSLGRPNFTIREENAGKFPSSTRVLRQGCLCWMCQMISCSSCAPERRTCPHLNCATSMFPSCLAFWPGVALAKTILTCRNFLRSQTDQVRISTKVDTATVHKGEISAVKKTINYTIQLSKSVYNASAPVALCSFATLRQVSLQVRLLVLPWLRFCHLFHYMYI